MDLFIAHRYLAYVVFSGTLAFLVYELWKLPNRNRRPMLLAFLLVVLAQSSTAIWLTASRVDPFRPYTSAEEAAAYFALSMNVIEWPLCFGVVHEVLNGYLAPYKALQDVGQRVFRSGMGFAALVLLASAFIAPEQALAALSFLFRFEPVLIYGCATLLCVGIAVFVWHFQLKGAANENLSFLIISLEFGQLTMLWIVEQFFRTHDTAAYWGPARVVVAAPIWMFAAMKLSTAGEARPSAVASDSQRDVRRALEELNTSLERGVRP